MQVHCLRLAPGSSRVELVPGVSAAALMSGVEYFAKSGSFHMGLQKPYSVQLVRVKKVLSLYAILTPSRSTGSAKKRAVPGLRLRPLLT